MHDVGYQSDKKLSYERMQKLLTSKSLSENEAKEANEFIDSTNDQITESNDYPFCKREKQVKKEINT